MSTVVVAVDGSAATDAALAIARGLARSKRASLHVLAPAGRRVEADGASVETYEGPADDAVLSVAEREGATLIVVSTRTGEDPQHVRLGRSARSVLARSRRPVVLVRPEQRTEGWALEHVLVPHDGSPTTSAALCPAAELARELGAELLALHVAPRHPQASQEAGSFGAPRYVDQPQHEWPAWASEFLDRVRSMCPFDPERTRFFLGHGEPAPEIQRIATQKDADLLVLAWHGTLAREHAETFRVLLRDAPCPMMVLRIPEEAASDLAAPRAAAP